MGVTSQLPTILSGLEEALNFTDRRALWPEVANGRRISGNLLSQWRFWLIPVTTVITRRAVSLAILAASLFLAAGLRGDRSGAIHSVPRLHILTNKPPIVLWAWEEPEDLRAADPQQIGVAFLAERIFVGNEVVVVPRRQRILVPASVWAEAVVRIEPTRDFQDNPNSRLQTAAALLVAASLPGIRSLQVDFDATVTQREFYADVLRQVRARLAPGQRLEITALVSWCSQPQSWMHNLPIDSAVPMYFRLGEHMGSWTVREPLCAGSIGVSTDEQAQQQAALAQFPVDRPTVYLFAPRPWNADQLLALNRGSIPQDLRGAR